MQLFKWLAGVGSFAAFIAVAYFIPGAPWETIKTKFRKLSKYEEAEGHETLTQTDAARPSAETWYVYRFSKKRGKIQLLRCQWIIAGDSRKGYTLTNKNLNDNLNKPDDEYKIVGSVTLNESQRLNIKGDGGNHYQQFFVSFYKDLAITRQNDKMVGIGAGEDFDRVLTSRIYLASRDEIDKQIAWEFLESITSKLLIDKHLIQLTKDVIDSSISEFFHDN